MRDLAIINSSLYLTFTANFHSGAFMTVIDTLSNNDQMFNGNLEEYLGGGQMALNFCINALEGKTPSVIVDFPSGHGRVLRWLKSQWPDSQHYAVEVDDDALKFVSAIFNATPIKGTPKLSDIKLPDNTDLIWTGSLLTHFNSAMWDEFFKITIDALKPGGILAFTIHGRLAMMLAERRDPIFGNLIDLAPLCEEYKENGFSYRDYDPKYPTYGLSFSSPSWVMRKLEACRNIKIKRFCEGAWGYQDILAVEKLASPI